MGGTQFDRGWVKLGASRKPLIVVCLFGLFSQQLLQNMPKVPLSILGLAQKKGNPIKGLP
ncbi:hypothetical protein A1332_22130 [Methylomonas methanica]|uniref:Uncharacterized protein n=1 Tax=Methylomonas methanica TaxID=421 RepID=A0A177LUL3_METMH|nr:hypothetical protein A1332_22130 [Methylomonas methanica]